MNLGNNLYHARKKCGLSQEAVAEKLGGKYPVLVRYQNKVNVPNYACRLEIMLEELENEYHYGEQDAFLVLKDILYHVWKIRNGKIK